MQISEIRTGDQIETFFLLQSASAKQSAAGKPFLTMLLADASGTIDGQMWGYNGPITGKDAGAVVWVRGTASEYRGAPQITVERLRLARPNEEYCISDLVPTAPIDGEKTWGELLALVDSLEDEDYAALCRKVLEEYGERFRAIPAAKSVHHGFLNGLLMHTASMLRLAECAAALYETFIDRSLLLAGTLLHDVSKCEEFLTSPLGLVTGYSTKGQLLGHLVMGAQVVAEAAAALHTPQEKAVLLQHMILSHHGEPEFGAAVPPICAESELLACLDKLDSRMEIYRENLPQVGVGECSRWIPALERRIYHHG